MDFYLTPSPLCEEFAGGVYSQYCYILLQLRYFSISLLRIKEIKIGYDENNIVNFADYTTILLKDPASIGYK